MSRDLSPGTVYKKELVAVDIDLPVPGLRLTEIDRPFEAVIFDPRIDALVTEMGHLALTTKANNKSRIEVHVGPRELCSLQYLSHEEAWTVFGDDTCAEGVINTAVLRDVTIN